MAIHYVRVDLDGVASYSRAFRLSFSISSQGECSAFLRRRVPYVFRKRALVDFQARASVRVFCLYSGIERVSQ